MKKKYIPRITHKITGYRLYSQLTEVTVHTFQDLPNFFLLFIFVYLQWVRIAAEKKARKDRALVTSQHFKNYKIRKKR